MSVNVYSCISVAPLPSDHSLTYINLFTFTLLLHYTHISFSEVRVLVFVLFYILASSFLQTVLLFTSSLQSPFKESHCMNRPNSQTRPCQTTFYSAFHENTTATSPTCLSPQPHNTRSPTFFMIYFVHSCKKIP